MPQTHNDLKDWVIEKVKTKKLSSYDGCCKRRK